MKKTVDYRYAAEPATLEGKADSCVVSVNTLRPFISAVLMRHRPSRATTTVPMPIRLFWTWTAL